MENKLYQNRLKEKRNKQIYLENISLEDFEILNQNKNQNFLSVNIQFGKTYAPSYKLVHEKDKVYIALFGNNLLKNAQDITQDHYYTAILNELERLKEKLETSKKNLEKITL